MRDYDNIQQVDGQTDIDKLTLKWSAQVNGGEAELVKGSIAIDEWAIPGFTDEQVRIAYNIANEALKTIGSSMDEIIDIDFQWKGSLHD